MAQASIDDDCVFCKIIKKELPAAKVFEDDSTIAFIDIAPVNKGHILVIPKRHSETLLHMDQRDAMNLMKTTQAVADAVKKATNADGVNILMNNFKSAGQIVPHAHIHIIPRFKTDGLKHWPSQKYASNTETEEYRRKIADEMI